MPVLTNPRHELFAQGIAQGKSGRQAYQDAGYPAKDAAADVNASKLLRQTKVSDRVAELQGFGAAAVEVTVASILADLAEDRALARQLGMASVAVAASMGRAKVAGLTVPHGRDDARGKRCVQSEPRRVRQILERALKPKALTPQPRRGARGRTGR